MTERGGGGGVMTERVDYDGAGVDGDRAGDGERVRMTARDDDRRGNETET